MKSSPAVRLFSSDLDGTLLGNPEAKQRFMSAWAQGTSDRQPLLVYNSGRLVENMQRLVASGQLIAPDYFIGGVGTQIFDVASGGPLGEFSTYLSDGWNRAKVDAVLRGFPGARPQPDEVQHTFKSSWFLDNASGAQLDDLAARLSAASPVVSIVYSSHRDLDVVPRRATKGGAIQWLCSKLNIPLTGVLVAGDTGNDGTMFRLPGVRGIIVANAQPELFEATIDIPTYIARSAFADGVLDGLIHFGVVRSD